MNIDKELFYRKALEKWLQENSDKTINDVPQRTIVKIISEREEIEVKLGIRINSMRQTLNGKTTGILTEDQIEYWVNQKGLSINARKDKFDNLETNYRKALEKWLEENSGKTINDITPKEVVILMINDQLVEIRLGTRITGIKQMLIGNIKCTLTEDQIAYWVNQKGLRAITRKDHMDNFETNYRKALEKWLEENPGKDVNEVTPKTIVKLTIKDQEIEVKLGVHIIFIKQKLTANTKCTLTEDQIDYWINQKGLRPISRNEKSKMFETNYRKALEKWLEENPGKTINDVPQKTIVKIVIEREEIEVKLGLRINSIRQKLRGNVEGTLKEDQINYWVNQKGLSIQTKNIINSSKDESCPDLLHNLLKTKEKTEYNIDNVLAEFHIDIDLLNKCLNRTRKEKDRSKLPVLMNGNKTLKSYCIRNGYNYNVIKKAIKLKEFCIHDSLEQLMNRVLTTYQFKGQKEPPTWIYEKYGTNIKEVFQYLKLDGQAILKDMANNIIGLEEGIRHNIFETTVKEKEHKYLGELYNYLIEEMNKSKQETIIEDLESNFKSIVKKYKLEKVEYTLLSKALKKYIEISKQYLVLEKEVVIVDKIFYRRRQLLAESIINWCYYSEQMREQIIENNKITRSELALIEQTRKMIDISNNQKKHQNF